MLAVVNNLTTAAMNAYEKAENVRSKFGQSYGKYFFEGADPDYL